MSKENVILTKFLRIGDRVEMNMSKESRGWSSNVTPNGTLGTVVGFYRYRDYITRNRVYSKLTPGIYEGNGAAFIAWDNGEFHQTGASYISFVNPELNEQRRYDKIYIDAFETMVRISDLPELPFYEGDLVLSTHRDDGPIEGSIANIEYRDVNAFRLDGSKMPIYDFEYCTGGTVRLEESDLQLIARGNYWHYYHKALDKLHFKDLKDEASFYQSIGKAEEIKNPRTDLYSWTVDEAFDAVKNGIGDICRVNNGFFGAGESVSVVKFPSLPDLGRRLREETIDQMVVSGKMKL